MRLRDPVSVITLVVAIIAGIYVPVAINRHWWPFLPTSVNSTVPPPVAGNSAQPSVEPSNRIWRQGTLSISAAIGGQGSAADLDRGGLLPIGTSISALDADVLVGSSPHGIVIQPGLPKSDGVSFDGRFVRVQDAPAGPADCAEAAISPSVSGILVLESNLHVGQYVCMVTTQGRLAVFEVVRFDNVRKEMTINYTVWEHH